MKASVGGSALHPLQRGLFAESANGGAAALHIAVGGGGAVTFETGYAMYPTSEYLSALDIPAASAFITPVSSEVRITPGFIERSALKGGTRAAPASWHFAQRAL